MEDDFPDFKACRAPFRGFHCHSMVFGNEPEDRRRRRAGRPADAPHLVGGPGDEPTMPAPMARRLACNGTTTEAFSSATVRYSGPTPASTPASTAAAEPAGVNPPASGSNTGSVTRLRRPAPSGTPPNQQQQGVDTPEDQVLANNSCGCFPRLSIPTRVRLSPLPAAPLLVPKPEPPSEPPTGPTLSSRTVKSDEMVKQALPVQPDSIPSPTRPAAVGVGRHRRPVAGTRSFAQRHVRDDRPAAPRVATL